LPFGFYTIPIAAMPSGTKSNDECGMINDENVRQWRSRHTGNRFGVG
jgi:hypothetical protein